MAKAAKKQFNKNMYHAILKLQTVEECEEFFEDLCSPTELASMNQRYSVAELLMEQTIYLDILNTTKASTATISRVKRMLTGGTGCLGRIIQQVKAEKGTTDERTDAR